MNTSQNGERTNSLASESSRGSFCYTVPWRAWQRGILEFFRNKQPRFGHKAVRFRRGRVNQWQNKESGGR
jgi:hypothetical protein